MSYETYNPNGPLIRKKNAARRRKELITLALENRTRPITLQALKDLQVNGRLPWEAFTSNIGKIFPLILQMVSEGDSIAKIEAFLGIRKSGLAKFIQLHPRLKKACNEARKIKSDRKSLEQIEIDFIMS